MQRAYLPGMNRAGKLGGSLAGVAGVRIAFLAPKSHRSKLLPVGSDRLLRADCVEKPLGISAKF
jgi:hypothetical protein